MLVLVLTTVTVAFVRTAPVESVTVPWIEAVVACPCNRAVPARTLTISSRHTLRNGIRNFMLPPKMSFNGLPREALPWSWEPQIRELEGNENGCCRYFQNCIDRRSGGREFSRTP